MLRTFSRPSLIGPKAASIRAYLFTSSNTMSSNTLVYLVRRDLRLEDNPIFHAIANKSSPFTHVLPVYVFAAQQIEVSGFIPDSNIKSPYPEARSAVANFWRCGPHRAKFLAESVWDLKKTLEAIKSGLEIRVGLAGEVMKDLVEGLSKDDGKVSVWMTSEEGLEEKDEERDVKAVCERSGAEFKVFTDEKYYIDDRDLPFQKASELPDIFTTYRKMVEPLRDAPRAVLPTPKSLPPLPAKEIIPQQHSPFRIPSSFTELETALLLPITLDSIIPKPPMMPASAISAHPFQGGASHAQARLSHLLLTGSMTAYKATRNGLIGTDFSSKLSAWLVHGCITARQIQSSLLAFEDGTEPAWKGVEGYGKGENGGTKAMRFELLWRDYMRLCTRKFGSRLFKLGGFREDESYPWRLLSHDESGKRPKSPETQTSEPSVRKTLDRLLNGTTGMGLIDASQRELFLTGYTSNRARQNVASFLSKHLGLDWRLGAEWYECMLVDYDVSSNWGNWQYVAGVGNDPRGEQRVFNPVKQAWDYDGKGEYVRMWIEEFNIEGNTLKNTKNDVNGGGNKEPSLAPNELFQAWEIPDAKREMLGLKGNDMCEKPLKRIQFTVGKRNSGNRNPRSGGSSHGGPHGGYRGKSEKTGGEKGVGRSGGQSRGGFGGSGGYANAKYGSGGNGGGFNGRGYGRGYEYGYGRGFGNGGDRVGGGGREARSGIQDKVNAAQSPVEG